MFPADTANFCAGATVHLILRYLKWDPGVLDDDIHWIHYHATEYWFHILAFLERQRGLLRSLMYDLPKCLLDTLF